MELNKTRCDLLYLAGCSIRQNPAAPERVRDMDLQALYDLSRFHTLDAMILGS